jgi:hypothetical protein
VPPKASDFDRQMQQLEAEIKRLEAEYNMFFAGRLPRPPWETRARVEPHKRSSGVLHESRIRDPLMEADRLKELYDQLTEARTKTGESAIPYHRFAEAVRAQVGKLGGGDSDVVFRVELKEGKATLAVKSAKRE